jgi:hypothetical protein
MTNYYEKLPRKAKGHKCQILTDDGDLCGKPCNWEVSAHLENELYYDGPNWVSFYVCQEHLDAQWLWKKEAQDGDDAND